MPSEHVESRDCLAASTNMPSIFSLNVLPSAHDKAKYAGWPEWRASTYGGVQREEPNIKSF
jgi:hypothetical protein